LTPKKILAVLDGSEEQTALQTARALAQRHGAELLALAVLEPPHDLAILSRVLGRHKDELLEELLAQKRAAVRAQAERIAPECAAEPQVVAGKAFIEIVRFVRAQNCDFVVKTAEPHSGVQRLLFASTDQHLMRKCPCPVWLQTAQASGVPRRILAAVDLETWIAAEPETLTALNRRVVDIACSVAAPDGADVIVLHAWNAMEEGTLQAFSGRKDRQDIAERYVSEVYETYNGAMQSFIEAFRRDRPDCSNLMPLLVRGTPETAIQTQSRTLKADLVVMGTVARTGLSGVIIGNTAENIINTLSCPVLAVKPPGFVSPLV